MDFDHYCHSWPLETVMPGHEASPDPVFIVKIEATHTYVSQSVVEEEEDDDGGVLQLDNLESETFEETFQVKRDAILQESTSRSVISDMLCAMHVPLEIQDFMIHRISACARDMVRQKQYASRRALRMCVTLGVTQCVPEILPHYSQVSRGPTNDDHVLGLPRTSKSSIEALEKVKIAGTTEQCAICLEDLIGLEATRMPCLHLFHGKCIVNWMERSNFCPLCRFKLPSRE